jgi:hypothetical protein
LGTIFRVAFGVLYRRIWSIVGKYSILCCDTQKSGAAAGDSKAVEYVVIRIEEITVKVIPRFLVFLVRRGRTRVNVQTWSPRDSRISFFMRREKVSKRKSARLEKRRKLPTPSVSPKRGELFAELEIEDSVLVTPPGETSSTPRSVSSDLNPDSQDREPEGEETRSEEETMTRLKYKRFKGDGHQDVDNWFSEFEYTAVANQEEDEAKQRIFQGLLKGEALK